MVNDGVFLCLYEKKATQKSHPHGGWVVPSNVLEPDDQRGQGFTGIRAKPDPFSQKNVPRVMILSSEDVLSGSWTGRGRKRH